MFLWLCPFRSFLREGKKNQQTSIRRLQSIFFIKKTEATRQVTQRGEKTSHLLRAEPSLGLDLYSPAQFGTGGSESCACFPVVPGGFESPQQKKATPPRPLGPLRGRGWPRDVLSAGCPGPEQLKRQASLLQGLASSRMPRARGGCARELYRMPFLPILRRIADETTNDVKQATTTVANQEPREPSAPPTRHEAEQPTRAHTDTRPHDPSQ